MRNITYDMSSFFSYNTSEQATGNTPLNANQVMAGNAFQTGTAAKIVGSVFADQPGVLQIQQSMSYAAVAATSGLAAPTVYWDIVATYQLDGVNPVTVDEDIIGPVARVVYTNGGTQQGALRIFLRAIGDRAAS